MSKGKLAQVLEATKAMEALMLSERVTQADETTNAPTTSASPYASQQGESKGETVGTSRSVRAHFGLDLSTLSPKGGWSATPLVLEATLGPKVQPYTPKKSTLPPPLNQEKPSSSGGGVYGISYRKGPQE